MKIGGKYRLSEVGRAEWSRLSKDLGVEPELALARIAKMARALPDEAQAIRERGRQDELDHPIIDALCDAVADRAARCAAQLPVLR